MFHPSLLTRKHASACALSLALCLAPLPLRGQAAAPAQIMAPQQVEKTFPASVFFSGQSAPVQYRNASALRFADGALFFAGLIDNSGYATGVQEKYQMYLLTEQPLLIGGKAVPAGAYGAGFVGDRFLIMDVGGHTVAEGQTEADEHLQRPRPLQLAQPGAVDVKLYLGRRWVRVARTAAK